MIDDAKKPLKEKYLEYYRGLPVQKLAADFINRSPDTIQDWMKEDEDFSAQVNQAKAEWATKTSKQVRSKEWLLERVMREEFAPNKQEFEGTLKIEILDYGADTKNNPTT